MIRYFKTSLLFFAIFLSYFQLSASHFENGMLWYEHVGGPQEYKYVFKTIITTNPGGLPITQNQLSMYVQHQSAAIVDTIPLNFKMPPPSKQHPSMSRSWWIENPEYCGNPNGLVNRGYQLFESDTITLDSNRVFNFSIDFVCCRDITTNGITSNLLLLCHLKTTTAPFSLIPPEFSLFDAIIPKDSLTTIGFIPHSPDSTFSSLSPIYSGNDAVNANLYNYASGFNAQSPFGAGSSINVNPITNPVLAISAPNVGNYNVGLKYTHVNSPQINLTWMIDGWYVADFNVRVTSGIDSLSYQPLTLDSLSSPAHQLCGEKKLILYSPSGFDTQSVDLTGQQFAVYKPDGSTNPILKAVLLDSSRIQLEMLEAIDTNGTFRIEPRLNFSGKYISSRCGYTLPMQDIFLTMSGCYSIGLKEVHLNFRFYPNPAKAVLYLEGYTPGTKVLIYNLQGQKVWDQTAQDKINLDLEAGVYWLELQSAKGERLLAKKLLVR